MQCKYCGKEFKNKKRKRTNGKLLDQIYCNIECYNKDKAARRYVCENCGITFTPANSHPHRFCCRQCMLDFSRKNKAEVKPKETIMKCCEWCGKEFAAKAINQKYCSKECYNQQCLKDKRAKYKPVPTKTMKCVTCGAKFEAKRTKKYCSMKCAKTETTGHKKHFTAIYKRDGGICQLCGMTVMTKEDVLWQPTLDHIISLSSFLILSTSRFVF